MATYYWRGSNGTWNGTTTTNWSLTSGGAGGAGPPTGTDIVIFNSLSGSTFTVTIDPATARAANTTITPAASGTVTLNSSSPATTANIGLTTIASASGATVRLGANLALASSLTHTGSTIDLNGSNLTCTSYINTGTSARALNFTTAGSRMTITGNGATVWSIASTTGMTLSGTNPDVYFTYTGSTGTRSISGGGSTTSVINAIFSGSGDTISLVSATRLNNLIVNGPSTATIPNSTLTILGSVSIPSGVTLSSGSLVWSFSGTGTSNVNIVPSLGCPITFNGTGTYNLQSNLTTSNTVTTTLTTGTIALNSYTLSTGLFSGSGSGVRSINFGTGKIVLTNVPATSATIWNFATATNFTTSGSKLIEIPGGVPSGRTRALTNASTGGSSNNTVSISLTASSADSIDVTGAIENLYLGNLTGSFPPNVLNIYGDFDVSSAGTISSSATVTTFLPPAGTTKTVNLPQTFLRALTFAGAGTSSMINKYLNMSTRNLIINSGTVDFGTGSSTIQCLTFTGSGGILTSNGSIDLIPNATSGALINCSTKFSNSVMLDIYYTSSTARTVTVADNGPNYQPLFNIQSFTGTGPVTVSSSSGSLRFSGAYFAGPTASVTSPLIIGDSGIQCGATNSVTFTGSITVASSIPSTTIIWGVMPSLTIPVVVDIHPTSTLNIKFSGGKLITSAGVTMYRGKITVNDYSSLGNNITPLTLNLPLDNNFTLLITPNSSTYLSNLYASGNGSFTFDNSGGGGDGNIGAIQGLNNFSVTGSTSFSSPYGGIDTASGALTLTTSNTVNFGTTTTTTVAGSGQSTLNYTAGSVWPNFSFTNATVNISASNTVPGSVSAANATSITLGGGGSFSSISLTSNSRKKITLTSNLGIGTLSISNLGYTARGIITSDVYANQRMLTLGNPISSSYLDFFGINLNYTGAGYPLSNTSIGDGGNNLNIIGNTPRTVYYNVGNANSWISSYWSILQGGSLSAPSTQYIPLPQDSVILANTSLATNFNSGSTISIDRDVYCTNITSTDRPELVSITPGNYSLFLLGNLEFNSNTTIDNGTLEFLGSTQKLINNVNSNQNLTVNAIRFNQDIDCRAPTLTCSGFIFNSGNGYFKNISSGGVITIGGTYLEALNLIAPSMINNATNLLNCSSITVPGSITFNGSVNCTGSIAGSNYTIVRKNCTANTITGTYVQIGTYGNTSYTVTANNIIVPDSTSSYYCSISGSIVNINNSIKSPNINIDPASGGILNLNNCTVYTNYFNASAGTGNPSNYTLNSNNANIILGEYPTGFTGHKLDTGEIYNFTGSVNLYLNNTDTSTTFYLNPTLSWQSPNITPGTSDRGIRNFYLVQKMDFSNTCTVSLDGKLFTDNLILNNSLLNNWDQPQLGYTPNSVVRVNPGVSVVKNLTISTISAANSSGLNGPPYAWRAPNTEGCSTTSAGPGWDSSTYYLDRGNFLNF